MIWYFLILMAVQIVLTIILIKVIKAVNGSVDSDDIKLSLIGIVPFVGILWILIAILFFLFTSDLFNYKFCQKIADWFNGDKE